MASCTLCMIAKNEGNYLLEWIAYHSLLGFDKIVIYENNSEDESAALLNKIAKRGYITHRNWPFGKTESPQITAYRDAIARADTDWILFIDADEFLVLKDNNLKELLEKFGNDDSVSAIGVNWRIFGSSNLQFPDDRLITERFNLASERDFAMNNHLKSFLKIKDIGEWVDMHLSDVNNRVIYADGKDIELESRGRSVGINHSNAQINHYFTKTFPEYQIKKNRGQAGIGENSELKYWYTDDAFDYHNRNEEEDLSLYNLREIIKSKMIEIMG